VAVKVETKQMLEPLLQVLEQVVAVVAVLLLLTKAEVQVVQGLGVK
jgi:hypothetical protein